MNAHSQDAASVDRTARIAAWNAYHNMAEVLCIEDGDDWRELTVADLVSLIAEAVKEAQS